MQIVIDLINCKNNNILETIIQALAQQADVAWRMDVTRENSTTSWYSHISIDMPSLPKVE